MQRFRQHEPAFVRNIEGIKGLRVWVEDFLGDKFPGGKVLDLEARAGHRDNAPGLGVAFLHLEPCGNGAVIQNIAVGLAVCGNKDGKIRNERLAFLTGCLVDRIMAVRQHFGGSKAVAVRGEQVALAFLRRIIATRRLQVDFKDGAGLRVLDHTLIRFFRIFIFGHIRVRVVRMLDKLDIAIDHGFRDLVLRSVQLHLVQRRGSAHLIDRIIQKITGAGLDFPYRPAIAADIVTGHKAAVRPGGIGIYQLAIVINPIGRPGKGGVALGGPGVRVALYHMHAEFLQNIAEMDGSSLAALNSDVLCGRGHIAVNRDFRHQVSAGQEFLFHLAVIPGSNSLIDFISQNIRAGNAEGNAGHNAVLTGLDDLRGAVGLRFDVHKEGNRVAGAGHHGLITRAAPDQHVVGNRNVFSELKAHRLHNHVFAGEGVLVAVPAHGHAAAGKHLQVDIQVVGVGNSQGIDLSAGVPFQFQNRGIPLIRRGKGRDGGVGRHLFQNPVVCLFRRTPGNHAVILVRRSVAVAVPAVGVAAKLLLVFPEDDLRRHFIIVLIDSGNRKGGAGFPAIDRSQGNAAPGSGREHIQVIAVGPVLRSIGIFGSVVGNPALHAVDRMGHAVRICQHVVPVGAAAGAGTFIRGSV